MEEADVSFGRNRVSLAACRSLPVFHE